MARIEPTIVDLRYTPRAWQAQVHRERKRFSVIAAARRSGKTRLALMELIVGALECRHEMPLFAYVAPFREQARTIAWGELKRIVEPLRLAGACEILEGDLSVRFSSGATIRLFGGDNPDALRGLKLSGVVVDEVAFIKPELWVSVINPALSDCKGFAFFIGTPAGQNFFSELWFKALTLPDWYAAKFTVFDTGALDAEEVERLRRDSPDAVFAREFLADFTAAGDNQLISLSDVEAAAQRTWSPRDIAGAPRIIGCDPARFGNDRTAIIMRQGLQAFPPVVLTGADNMAVASRVASLIEELQPAAVFIDSSGAGILDRLRQLRYAPIEVPFGGKALKPTLYNNRRTEMFAECAAWLQAGAIPNDPSLKAELSAGTFSFDAHGRKCLESKDEIKKRLSGASPDLADALALTFAAPVRAMSPIEVEAARVRVQRPSGPRTYDPFANLDNELREHQRRIGYDPFGR